MNELCRLRRGERYEVCEDESTSEEGGYLIEKYNIILCDPPWRYNTKGGQDVAENHYPTMSMDICALPVAELAAKDSALFLWATFPMLPEALRD